MSRLSAFSIVQRLFRRRSPQPPADDYEQILLRLQGLESTLTTLADRPLSASPSVDPPLPGDLDERLEAVQQGLAAVEKQLQRSGREQLKANALIEAQQEQARGALELLEATTARRDEEVEALRQQLAAVEDSARLGVVRQLLPTLDGIDEALRAGDDLLGPAVSVPRQMTLFERMRTRDPLPTPDEARLRDALRSWLHGLTFVRQRLLDLLASVQVRPIDALHAPFDPTLHIALEAVPATSEHPPGTVIAVMRNGYTVGERVLRHAEVAVAQEWERTAQGTAV